MKEVITIFHVMDAKSHAFVPTQPRLDHVGLCPEKESSAYPNAGFLSYIRKQQQQQQEEEEEEEEHICAAVDTLYVEHLL
jgi:hypothetical protein